MTRSDTTRKWQAAKTPEQRSESARKRAKTMGARRMREIARLASEAARSRTPEQRSESAHKANMARRPKMTCAACGEEGILGLGYVEVEIELEDSESKRGRQRLRREDDNYRGDLPPSVVKRWRCKVCGKVQPYAENRKPDVVAIISWSPTPYNVRGGMIRLSLLTASMKMGQEDEGLIVRMLGKHYRVTGRQGTPQALEETTWTR